MLGRRWRRSGRPTVALAEVGKGIGRVPRREVLACRLGRAGIHGRQRKEAAVASRRIDVHRVHVFGVSPKTIVVPPFEALASTSTAGGRNAIGLPFHVHVVLQAELGILFVAVAP